MGSVRCISAIVFVFFTVAAFGASPGSTRPATTQASTRPPTVGELGDLIKQLEAGQWAARQHASDRIALLGEAARPELERRLKAGPDAGLAQDLEDLLGRLDQDRRYGPTLVTLRLEKAPAHEVFAALASQAKVSFNPAPETFWQSGDEPRVTVDCKGEPFWSCLQQICTQSKLRMTGSSPGKPIQIATADANLPAAPYAVAGPFLFKVKQITNSRSASFEGANDPNAVSGCHISLFAWGEPKIPQAMWMIDRPDETFVDGATLPASVTMGSYNRGGQVGSNFPGMMTFRKDLPGKRLTRVRANAQFTFVDKTEKFEVPNVMAAGQAERTIGGYVVQLKGVNRMDDDRYAFTVEITRGSHTVADFSAFQRALSHSQARLLDSEGKPLNFNGGSGSSSFDKLSKTTSLTRSAGQGPKVGEPTTFVWEIPSHLKTVSFPVELKDLPLP
jgi:hypothetical protein